MQTSYTIDRGSPAPLGSSVKDDTYNFALFAPNATAVSLCLFKEDRKLFQEIPLSPEINKTENVWHASISQLDPAIAYAYKISPQIDSKQDYLLDPYAKSLSVTNLWGKNNRTSTNEFPYQPFGNLPQQAPFDWGNDSPPQIPLNNLIIYEMSIRGFTKDPSSNVSNPGTFLGVIEKIPHLVELGINAVELLPIHEFNECEYSQYHPNLNDNMLYNFWGYSTVSFFSPMNRYAFSDTKGAVINEFKTMVKKLHEHGIEIILDVVFNHTAEGDNTGPVLSFKGIDNAVYYLLDDKKCYLNFSGCGNSLNANHPAVVEMIIDSLCYWVNEMHVDGFRFDLASALTRGGNGTPLEKPPLIEAILNHPVLAKVKLIAEAWDAVGLYQVGHFAPSKRLSEWNDKYRDGVRRFIKGSAWTSGEFATRLCGSQDLYDHRGPCASLNFITAHDGFSLADLVSYNVKHNIENGEGNRDGHNDNQSWNCGVDGPTTNKKILQLRERQMKNFHLALMLSQGIPMLLMGDEYGHTKNGNNNTWCQDNELNWFQWRLLEENTSFYRFYRLLVYFRKQRPILRRLSFLNNQDVDWHGFEAFKPDWNNSHPFIAFTLKDHQYNHDLYVVFNAQDHAQQVEIPPPPYAKQWYWTVNTGNPSPSDFFENGKGPIQHENSIKLQPYSAIVLEAR